LLIAGVAQELWRRDPQLPLQIFQAEVDDSGFDLVLGCGGVVRYIQVKQVHVKGAASKFSVRLQFSRLSGSCVVVVAYEAESLDVKHFLFFGSVPNKPMPPIDTHKPTKSPGRRDQSGTRKVREHYRDVPRNKFSAALTVSELVDHLFPQMGHNPSLQRSAASDAR
jgi:hypothetical protein